MRRIRFLESGCSRKNPAKIIQRVNRDIEYWQPIMLGIATRAEMELATQEDVQIYNEVARRKFELLYNGGES